jgi:hypothetical protein
MRIIPRSGHSSPTGGSEAELSFRRGSVREGEAVSVNRPVIAWDVDDVLNELMREWLRFACAEGLVPPDVPYESIVANPPHQALSIPPDAYLESLDRFRLTRAAHLRPRPNVLTWFERHGERAHHVAITATALIATPVSAQWVMHHFGRWIRTLVFVPSPRAHAPLPTFDESKAAALSRFGRIDVLVDDTPKNFVGIESVPSGSGGLVTLLWPQPWNASPWSEQETLEALGQLVARF